ncbi:MAG: hypothetical protein EHM35_21340 [Planctomycetaceae bacterium]|nr:MAG: hypothetical protein EHM35_21340 [Planctomycetaceae bacterium]
MKSGCRRVAGGVLLIAFVVSWFVWGPLALIFYVGGLFNSLWLFMLSPCLFLLIPLTVIFLPVLARRTVVRWRKLSGRERVLSSLLMVLLAAFVASFGLGFAGVTPSPFDMFLRGFTRYVESRTDVSAIQAWLGMLDPNEYTDKYGARTERHFTGSEQPPCVARLHAGGARVQPDDKGRLMLRTIWGGGLIGHWGIEVGGKSMEPPPDSEVIGYQPLAPGAWIWYEN